MYQERVRGNEDQEYIQAEDRSADRPPRMHQSDGPAGHSGLMASGMRDVGSAGEQHQQAVEDDEWRTAPASLPGKQEDDEWAARQYRDTCQATLEPHGPRSQFYPPRYGVQQPWQNGNAASYNNWQYAAQQASGSRGEPLPYTQGSAYPYHRGMGMMPPRSHGHGGSPPQGRYAGATHGGSPPQGRYTGATHGGSPPQGRYWGPAYHTGYIGPESRHNPHTYPVSPQEIPDKAVRIERTTGWEERAANAGHEPDFAAKQSASFAKPTAIKRTSRRDHKPSNFTLLDETAKSRRYEFRCPDPDCPNHNEAVMTPWLMSTSNKFRCTSSYCKAKKQKNNHTIPAHVMRQHLIDVGGREEEPKQQQQAE